MWSKCQIIKIGHHPSFLLCSLLNSSISVKKSKMCIWGDSLENLIRFATSFIYCSSLRSKARIQTHPLPFSQQFSSSFSRKYSGPGLDPLHSSNGLVARVESEDLPLGWSRCGEGMSLQGTTNPLRPPKPLISFYVWRRCNHNVTVAKCCFFLLLWLY